MSRHGIRLPWFLAGLLGPMLLSTAWGQVGGLQPIVAPSQLPAIYGSAADDLYRPGPPQPYVAPLVDLTVQTDDPGMAGLAFGQPSFSQSLPCVDCYQWQLLPNGLMYKSYLAGGREPRFASQLASIEGHTWVWDSTLGGRVGMIRFGSTDEVHPEGWQLDLEGAAFPRLGVEHEFSRELICVDFRIGAPLTLRQGPWEAKFGYYHLSSHMGDEYLVLVPEATRINYVRDGFVLGVAVRPHPDLRLYGEAGWAFNVDGGAEPWEFQFGVDYSPAGATGILGAPFFAANGYLREENDFGGGLTLQTGLQWADRTGHLLRIGVHYFNGQSDQRQFFATHDEMVGLGMWYDY